MAHDSECLHCKIMKTIRDHFDKHGPALGLAPGSFEVLQTAEDLGRVYAHVLAHAATLEDVAVVTSAFLEGHAGSLPYYRQEMIRRGSTASVTPVVKQ